MKKIRRVLVIPDEPNTFDLIHKLLADEYDCIMANTIAEGIDYFKLATPDIMLIDLKVSGKINGFDSRHALRSRLNNVNLPILYLASKEITHSLPTHKKLADAEHILQPISPFELTTKIYRALIRTGNENSNRVNTIKTHSTQSDNSERKNTINIINHKRHKNFLTS